ncbi:hypothetical protein GGR51DRAFT_378339 [Nemania sp. FL0031]|nr:hypothetical protein GGR51DRAFT_378339 [Nemania sp. FL0031]
MHSNAMRWFSRPWGPARGAQAFLFHHHSHIPFARSCVSPKLASKYLQISPSTRTLWSSSRFQVKASSECAPLSPLQPPASGLQGTRWISLALIFAASAGAAYLYRRQCASPDDDVINTSTFTPFIITDREQVSPTAFIITLRPSSWVDSKGLEAGYLEDDEPAGLLSNRIRDAWHHGLWSVEIKQPQLQIARHYTPLPPLPTQVSSLPREEKSPVENIKANEVQTTQITRGGSEQADLRILIRKMDGGEMSNYLSRQRVGDTVWLRGPHLGFDVPRRLGRSSAHNGDVEIPHVGNRPRVVFLAGGTGIAPALQIAHKLLDGYGSSSDEKTQPHISILWANRWGIDAVGRESPLSHQRKPSSWFRFWDREKSNPREAMRDGASSSLALQIQDLKRRHPSHFEISYFVDNEGSFIKAHDVEAALASTASVDSPGTRGPSSSPTKVNKSCTWHSAKAVELLPDDNDAARSASLDLAHTCTCTIKTGVEGAEASPRPDLVFVSGPDGFIEAYAGRKRWHDGNEMQGAVRGLIGRIKEKGTKADEWLVLKL